VAHASFPIFASFQQASLIMATRSAPNFSFQFLPPQAAAWMRLRAIETLGIACALTAGWLLLALFTYDAADPSFNHATNAAPANMAGLLGAFTSDLAFTWLGVAAYLPSLILFAWARRLIVRHALPNPAWRLVMTPIALLLICPAMTLAAWPGADGLPAGPGGLAGALIATAMIKVPLIADLAVGWVVLARLCLCHGAALDRSCHPGTCAAHSLAVVL